MGTAVVRLLPGQGGGNAVGFLSALAVAMSLHPVHAVLRRQVDRLFLGERVTPAELLAGFPKSPLTDPVTVGSELVQLLQHALGARWVQLKLIRGLDLAIGEVPALVAVTATVAIPSSPCPLREVWQEGAASALILVLQGAAGREGILIIGPNDRDMPHDAETLAALTVLGGQAATALHTAHLAGQMAELQVKEAAAKTQARVQQEALLAVDYQLRQELAVIQRAIGGVEVRSADGTQTDGTQFETVRQSLVRVTAYLDRMTGLVQSAPAELEEA